MVQSSSLISFIVLSSPLAALSFTQSTPSSLTTPSTVSVNSGLSFAGTPEFQTSSNDFFENNKKQSSFTALYSSSSASEAVNNAVETLTDAEIKVKTPITLSTKTAVMAGTVLALTSGFINGACVTGFFSASQATAAVTGTWTNCAIAAAKGQTARFVMLAKYLLAFMSGSTIAGLLTPEAKPFEVADPKGVASAFGVGSIALAVAGMMAKTGGLSSEAILMLCFVANGIQNSLTSAFTANLCRTTHFSGITSDIGTFLGQALRGNRNNILKLKVFPLLAFAFWSGSFIAYPLTKSFASGTLYGAATVYGLFATTMGVLSMKK